MSSALTPEEAYHELCGYTLTLRDPEFIHQHVVDAYAAQNADEQTKPIKLTFALIGLYLHLEKNCSGRQVQRMHQYLAARKRAWPRIPVPAGRGAVTAADVLARPAGVERSRAIDAWCGEVWAAFRASHGAVAELLKEPAAR